MLTLKSMFIGVLGARLGLRSAPATGAKDHPEGRAESSMDMVQSAVREPVAVRAI